MPPKTLSDFAQAGRVDAPDPKQQQVSVTNALDFSGPNDYEVDFAIINQKQQFGIPRSLFIDNGTNPSSVIVTVGITNQVITVAPFSIGNYLITANDKSRIRLVSNGGASDKCTLTVFNYAVQPSVWYSYGATNPNGSTAVTIADGSDIALGATANPSWAGAGAGTVISILKAIWDKLTTPVYNGGLTDSSITNLSGASEPLIAANVDRRILVIHNPNAANPIAVNLTGGVAALNTGASITLLAGETIRFDSFCPTDAITVIGTAADDVTAYEG